jgi:predicted MFS family arabinose efflux permease
MIFSTFSARLAHRFGVRRMLIAGMSIITLSMLYFTRLPLHATYSLDLLPGFIGLAIGMGLGFFSTTVAGTSGVANQQQGIASGLINASSQVGSALGLAVLISVGARAAALAVAGGEADPAVTLLISFRTAHAGAAIFAAVATVIAMLAVRPGSSPSPSERG